uniref:G-protein coupled receptors family 1 profile domain-containing protein n=1 Tax=Monopterus albus TaxID=43700 RepID=A0A3Q3IY33_MONAL
MSALLTLYTSQQTRNSSQLSSPLLQHFHNSSTPSFFNVTSSSPSSSPPPADLVISPNMVYMVAELVIAFLSTFGNLLVCAAVALNRNLQTVTNYFLVSLAVADICVGAIAIPCAILTDIGLPRHNLYLCLLMLSVLIMLTQSSIFSLLAVAVERYVAIFMPFRYQVLVTSHNAVLVILATWLLAFVIGLVPLMGWHKTPPESGYCFFVLVVDMTYMVYFNFFACVLTPLVIMFLIYAQIFIMVRRHVRRTVSEKSGRGEGQVRAAASMRREMKTATSLFLLLLTAIILSHANSAVNPFLYAYTMRAFRDTFKAIFLSSLERNQEQEYYSHN